MPLPQPVRKRCSAPAGQHFFSFFFSSLPKSRQRPLPLHLAGLSSAMDSSSQCSTAPILLDLPVCRAASAFFEQQRPNFEPLLGIPRSVSPPPPDGLRRTFTVSPAGSMALLQAKNMFAMSRACRRACTEVRHSLKGDGGAGPESVYPAFFWRGPPWRVRHRTLLLPLAPTQSLTTLRKMQFLQTFISKCSKALQNCPVVAQRRPRRSAAETPS